MLQRRHLLALPLLATPALLRPSAARAQEVTLRLHHFLPAVSNVHRFFLQPWAQKVAAESNNRIRIQIFPAMQLGGAPPQLFDQARDGVADIIWTLPGSTPGRFPRIEVFELPFVAHKRAAVNVQAVQTLVERRMQEEFKDVHLITAWGHDAGVIHSRREVRRMEDMAGLKLRFPTRQTGEALKALGAAPVGMPVPQVPEALSQGVIDGAVVPWEVVPSIRLHEMVKNHTEIAGSPTLYVATFILAMNPAKYAALPADLRAVIDANSGQAAARMAARPWDEEGPKAEEMVRRRGNQIVELPEEERNRWQRQTAPVVDTWIAAMKDRGIDGGGLLEEARALVAQYGQGVS
ncbi:TRAP transporter substrate-binding protein [Paeniroseomonas aquatica]|uniref:TRAP transporter substrate-binding protein n=1 Tax=Paeniroseomonas aquatica TaxID=373043 RepID=A0ABT8AA84_9PROT|nr:TRAP transporter substrate-binding protein [Paeniroseomonas aquatica]MDN3566341.1 TRAP transporter substrate-binding protein [Paeniroseomonas aquatica]